MLFFFNFCFFYNLIVLTLFNKRQPYSSSSCLHFMLPSKPNSYVFSFWRPYVNLWLSFSQFSPLYFQGRYRAPKHHDWLPGIDGMLAGRSSADCQPGRCDCHFSGALRSSPRAVLAVLRRTRWNTEWVCHSGIENILQRFLVKTVCRAKCPLINVVERSRALVATLFSWRLHWCW